MKCDVELGDAFAIQMAMLFWFDIQKCKNDRPIIV